MRGTRSILGAGRSLHRFFTPSGFPEPNPTALFARHASPPQLFLGRQVRRFTDGNAKLAPVKKHPRPNRPSRPPARPQQKQKASRKLIDRKLLEAFEYVHFRNEDNTLSPPKSSKKLLRDIDFKEQILITLALPNPDDPDNKLKFPVCRLQNREEFSEAEKAKKKEERRKNVASKELVINWGIGTNDLQLKLSQLKKFLEKGCAVDISLLNKNRRIFTGKEAAQNVLAKVQELIASVEGASDVRVDGEPGLSMTVNVKGPQGRKKAQPAKPSVEGITSEESPPVAESSGEGDVPAGAA